ncbi:MAG: MmgE/PrpD family protein, partial [Pseudomonadota bacterium]
PDGQTLARLRDGVVDGLGCILAGAESEAARGARQAVALMEGQGRTPVLGTSLTAPRPQAALLNAVAAHALDFDDWEVPGNTHPTAVLLPAILAAARPRTSGRAVAAAYLAGFEVIARVGQALTLAHYDRGWHATATLGALGGAAAASRVRGLTGAQATAALSFAVSRAAGYTCQFGSHAKALQAGFAAETGVTAALLAEAGLRGQAHALDHARGFACLMAGAEGSALDAALSRMGDPLALQEFGLALKAWPTCAYTHRVLAATIRLGPLAPAEIARVQIQIPAAHAAIAHYHQPASLPEALFSLPFAAAMGLTTGGLRLTDLAAERWAAPELRALIALTEVHPFQAARPDQTYDAAEPDRVAVSLRDGRHLEAAVALPPGMPETPLSPEAVASKFRANAGLGEADPLTDLMAWTEAEDAPGLLARISSGAPKVAASPI